MNTNALLATIDAARVAEHHRFYVTHGRVAVEYLRRGEDEFFTLLACGDVPFARLRRSLSGHGQGSANA